MPTTNAPPQFLTFSNPYPQPVIMEMFESNDLTFVSKNGMQVTIDGKTGHVHWSHGTPDSAARTFWDAVQLAFPEVVKKMGRK